MHMQECQLGKPNSTAQALSLKASPSWLKASRLSGPSKFKQLLAHSVLIALRLCCKKHLGKFCTALWRTVATGTREPRLERIIATISKVGGRTSSWAGACADNALLELVRWAALACVVTLSHVVHAGRTALRGITANDGNTERDSAGGCSLGSVSTWSTCVESLCTRSLALRGIATSSSSTESTCEWCTALGGIDAHRGCPHHAALGHLIRDNAHCWNWRDFIDSRQSPGVGVPGARGW